MGNKKNVTTVLIMIIAAAVSKLLGMLRGIIFAAYLGDNVFAVAFTAASKLPLSIFDMLFSASILGCFIPFYSDATIKSEKNAQRFSSAFFSFVLIFTSAIALSGIFFSRQIISVAAPSLGKEASELASVLLKIMFPMIIFTGCTYVLVGVHQSRNSFIVPSLVSVLSNTVIITSLFLLKNKDGKTIVTYLSVIYVISWLVQFLTLAVPLIKKHLLPGLTLNFKNSDILNAVRKAPGITAAAWLTPASALISMFLSSFVSDETVVSFDYSLSLYLISAGILTYGICNYIFPSLSKKNSEGNEDGAYRTVLKGLYYSLLISIPVSAGLFFLSEEITAVIYMRGNFSRELASSCASVLKILSLSVPAFCINELFIRAFYASRKIRYPVISAFIGITTFIFAGSVSVFILKAGIRGISVSYSIAQYFSAVFLLISHTVNCKASIVKSGIYKICSLLLPTLILFASMYITDSFFVKNAFFSSLSENIIRSAIVFFIGCMLYLLCIYLYSLYKRNQNTKEDGTL